MLPLLLPLLVTVVAVAAAVAVADTVAVAVVMFLPGYCTLACALIQSIKRQAQLSAYQHKPSGSTPPSPLAQVPLSSLRALPLTWLFWGLFVNVLNNATRLAYRSFACMHH